MKQCKAVLFDLDGTLLDTLQDMTDSVNYTMRALGKAERTAAEVRAFVGNGARRLME
ncbi:MAG: HAD hydrolase-like protein, partial [Oscillospiraceae bacterium]|nr:HAD hydrolase-like protein [Oscillospiraceae bacterium]